MLAMMVVQTCLGIETLITLLLLVAIEPQLLSISEFAKAYKLRSHNYPVVVNTVRLGFYSIRQATMPAIPPGVITSQILKLELVRLSHNYKCA